MNILRSLSLTYRSINLLGTLLMSASSALAEPEINETSTQLNRTDRYVTLEGGEQLHIREVSLKSGIRKSQTPVLLIHGARVPGVASFDLSVRGASLAADWRRQDFGCIYLICVGMGHRAGFGEMDASPDQSAPLIRTADAINDLAHTVQAVQAWSGSPRISIWDGRQVVTGPVPTLHSTHRPWND